MTDGKHLVEIIKDRIKIKTRAKRVSRGKVAEFLGVTEGKLRAWEAGQRPSADDLQNLVVLLNFTPNWLLTGEGEVFLGEEASAQPEAQKETVAVTDPIAQRLEIATRILKESGASPEVIQQAVMKILDSQNETHTQAETNTLEASAFADKCEWSMKRT